ncbi:MAG: NAD(P)H-binding protein, partial [Sandaracinus sp.]|nr:NAD(P)H-binding protein [Sandaracinus sp.]
MSERILVYGATGYTGRLIAGEAASRGLDVVLAGRNAERLKAVAEPLGLETRAFELADPARLRAALEDVAAVLHVAGPFSATAEPMVEACLET